MNLPASYDTGRLATPWDDCHEIGIEAGDECGRMTEPCDDAPRGYRPRPCTGEMIEQHDIVVCCTCGEIA